MPEQEGFLWWGCVEGLQEEEADECWSHETFMVCLVHHRMSEVLLTSDSSLALLLSC